MNSNKSSEVVRQTGKQLNLEIEIKKYFIGNNEFRRYSYTNSTGGEVTINPGDTFVYSPVSDSIDLFDSGTPNVPEGGRLVICAETKKVVPDTESATFRCAVKGLFNENILTDANAIPFLDGSWSDLNRKNIQEIGKFATQPI
jgi:hypothetical protein